MSNVRGRVSDAWQGTADLPIPVRAAIASGSVLGVLGGLAGLVIGLAVHPPTAWFAVIEVGLPAGVLGGLLGLIAGAVIHVASRLRGPSQPR